MTESPKISVVIVNYNVAFFLEQCLNSVAKAMSLEPAEVWVVDNNSVDESVDMVRHKFPWVKVIANKDNKGFSKANNQAMELSNCKYQLLLNPDTVIEEDTLKKVVDYMEAHLEVGGLGVRMVDGKGVFLPESKRGLPTPAVAFYKIFGISRIFPKSKKFGRYHLGYLSEFETNEIEILSGAFMLMRKEALDKVGLLDEDFFMYGEDIDLSYRIIKGGYKNVYFPETRIIHYKGESTKKSSVNYVFVFYRAMVIFARKHFSQKNARLFSFLINCAIYFRAGLAILSRFIRKVTLPIIDATHLLIGLLAISTYWHSSNIHFPEKIYYPLITCYTAIWMLSVLFKGGYDAPIKLKKYLVAPFLGTAFILMLYALFPKSWQFSRLYVLTGTTWVAFYYILSRLFLHFSIGNRFKLNGQQKTRFAVVGSIDEFNRISHLLHQTQPKVDEIIHVDRNSDGESNVHVSNLEQIIQIKKIDEVVFSAKDNAAHEIISWMIAIPHHSIDFKIAQPDSSFLIGSNSIETAGDLYIIDVNAITQAGKIRQKRTIDFLTGFFCLLFSPLIIWIYSNKKRFYQNAFRLLSGSTTLVSYRSNSFEKASQLPKLKPGIFPPYANLKEEDESVRMKLNLLYAREYNVWMDLRILRKNWDKLDK